MYMCSTRIHAVLKCLPLVNAHVTVVKSVVVLPLSGGDQKSSVQVQNSQEWLRPVTSITTNASPYGAGTAYDEASPTPRPWSCDPSWHATPSNDGSSPYAPPPSAHESTPSIWTANAPTVTEYII